MNVKRGDLVEGRTPQGAIKGRVFGTWTEERMGRTVSMAGVAWFGGIGRGSWPVDELTVVDGKEMP